MSEAAPRISLVIPAWRSEATIAASLESFLAQGVGGVEVVVVDSSPEDHVERIVAGRFPSVRLLRKRERCLPHAARNAGVAVARGALLVFTDPDIYAAPGWLERLLAAREAAPGGEAIVVGALACHGAAWLDVGIHLAKFHKWLPGGERRPIDDGPSAALLCSRASFEALGGLDGDLFAGDTVFCRRARERGLPVLFEPRAVGAHHHVTPLGEFLRERWVRGVESGRTLGTSLPRGRALLLAAASIAPLRLVVSLARIARRAAGAGLLGQYARTFPVVLGGAWAWTAGQGLGLWRAASR